LVATIFNLMGSSALFSFEMIYFHEVRGISLGQAGLAIAATSLVVVAFTPVAGWMSDRFGPRLMLVIGCLVSIVAGSCYILVTTFTGAVLVSALLGLGNALWWPSQSALMSLIVQPHERPALSAFHRAAVNLGAALGGVIGGVLVSSGSLSSFRWLFAFNVLSYLVFLTVVPGLPSGRVERAPRREDRPGFRLVLSDGFFVRLLGTDIAIALSFGFLFSVMPAYASQLGIGNATIGVLFMFGAAAVVITQIPTLRWVSGRRRMRMLTLMNLWFVAAFALMLTTPYLVVGVAVVVIAVGQVLGGFGEALLGAVRQPLTSDLAPPEVVGRYFGLAAMVFQGSMGAANALGGVLMQHSLHTVWLLPLAAALCGAAGTTRLGRRVPAHVAVSP
jgi:MFS family permease